MIDFRQRLIDRYGENTGRIMFVAECQRKGLNPVNGQKVVGGLSDEEGYHVASIHDDRGPKNSGGIEPAERT